jgi:hypothetical protein
MNDREQKEADARTRRAEKLVLWYETQTERLGLTRDQLEAALLRGWTGDEIARFPTGCADDLNGPPYDIEHLENRIRIRAADVQPVKGLTEDDQRRIQSAHGGH